MHLDRCFARAKFRGDLLVQHPAHHEAQDVRLRGVSDRSRPKRSCFQASVARRLRSRSNACPPRSSTSLSGPALSGNRRRPPSSQSRCSGCRRVPSGTRWKWRCLARQTSFAGRGRCTRAIADPGGCSRTIQRSALQQLFGGREQLDFERLGFEKTMQRSAKARVIIHNEYDWAGLIHAELPSMTGNAKWKVAPRSGLLTAHRRPPWDSMIDRLIDRPMPFRRVWW